MLIVSFCFTYKISKPTLIKGQKPSIESSIDSSYVLGNNNFSKISEYDNNFNNYDINDLFVLSNKAYLAAGYEGLIIFDISDITSPKIIGQFSNGNFIRSVYVANDLAFLTAKKNGLFVVNCSNLNNIVTLSKYKVVWEWKRI